MSEGDLYAKPNDRHGGVRGVKSLVRAGLGESWSGLVGGRCGPV